MTDKAAPTEWDRRMAALLKPLADLGLNHSVLFYANTFPIAFHYAYALGKEPSKELLNARLNAGSWDVPPKEPAACFFYGNEANGEAEVRVSTFSPKYVFAFKTLAVAHAFDKAVELNRERVAARRLAQRVEFAKPILTLNEFLDVARKKYNKVILYTEILELGKYLKQRIGNSDEVELYTPETGEHLPLTQPFRNRAASTMRLFVYGGPLSTYLLRKQNYYVGLLLDESNEGITTSVRLEGIVKPRDLAKAKSAIASYHHKLFADAKKLCSATNNPNLDKCPPFYSVYRAYNEMAWMLQHRSSFKSAQEYAQCLVDHHVTPKNARKRGS